MPVVASEPKRDPLHVEASEAEYTDAGRQFLKSKLAELDSFKSDPKFQQFGFAVGGPFNSWLKSVQSKRDANDFSFLERVALGDLLLLGLEYVKTRGEESDDSHYSREQVADVIERRSR